MSDQTAGQARPTREELERMQLFKGIDIEQIQELLERCKVREIELGKVLINGGEAKPCMFLVLSGRLRIYLQDNARRTIAFIKPGESVGEMSILDHQPAPVSVKADEPTRVLELSEDLMWEIFTGSPIAATNMLRILATRLRSDNSPVSHSKEDLHEHDENATIDSLTGLFNRLWSDQMLPMFLQKYGGRGQDFSLMMIDIDHFQHFNDTHGHVAGDKALQTVARCLKGHLRSADVVVRYGGGELMVLLPDTDLNVAMFIGERLRGAVESSKIFLPNNITLRAPTISIGIAELAPRQSVESLVDLADKALYRAKHAGRNRACC